MVDVKGMTITIEQWIHVKMCACHTKTVLIRLLQDYASRCFNAFIMIQQNRNASSLIMVDVAAITINISLKIHVKRLACHRKCVSITSIKDYVGASYYAFIIIQQNTYASPLFMVDVKGMTIIMAHMIYVNRLV